MNKQPKERPDGKIPAEKSLQPICISAENLSAELDGEYHFSAAEQNHLQHCPRCRNLYESYRIIDDAVTRTMTVNCSRLASLRIRKNVNRELDRLAPMRTHEPIRFSALIARVAAVAAIAVMAGYLIFVDNPYSHEAVEEPIVASSEVHTEPASAAAAPVGGVDIRHLRLAAAGAPTNFRFTDPAAEPDRVSRIAVIPASVKQVWLVKPDWKTEKIERVLRSALEHSGVPLKAVRVTLTPDGGLRANLTLTRYQTVNLTRYLAGQNFQLISPSQPQPEQELFAGTGGELVDLETVLIPRGS